MFPYIYPHIAFNYKLYIYIHTHLTRNRLRRSVAKRSYALPKVRGGDRECQAATAQEQPRGASPCPRSGVAAKRGYRMPEVREGGPGEQPQVQGVVAVWVQEGREELLHVQGQEGQP